LKWSEPTYHSIRPKHILIDGELVLDMEPKIKTRGREVRLTLIFGNRIAPKAPGYFYSPPNI
jgi:hypothetical protein